MGRYQLVGTSSGGAPALLLIDTMNGETWYSGAPSPPPCVQFLMARSVKLSMAVDNSALSYCEQGGWKVHGRICERW